MNKQQMTELMIELEQIKTLLISIRKNTRDIQNNYESEEE